METTPPASAPKGTKSRMGLWGALTALALVIALFLFGKYTNFINFEALQEAIRVFADGPWGIPALILTFCVCAFIGVPQFILIGVAVYAFGSFGGAFWAWVATLISGTLTFWLGHFFGQATLERLGEGRIKRFSRFVARNAFSASIIVRNAPAGPFLMVNMVFGAVRAKYSHYLAGMALGILPKIAVIAFGIQAIESALGGNLWLAGGTALAALVLFLGGFFYVRYRRNKGDNIALSGD